MHDLSFIGSEKKNLCTDNIYISYWKSQKCLVKLDACRYDKSSSPLPQGESLLLVEEAKRRFLGQRETGLRRSRFSIKIRYSLVTVSRRGNGSRVCVEGRATLQKRRKKEKERKKASGGWPVRRAKNNEETSCPSTSDSCRISVASTSLTALDNSPSTSSVGI